MGTPENEVHRALCHGPLVGDHEYACVHDLMMHLRNEPQARDSIVYDAFDV
jgi:hypothetical protein